MIKTYSGGLMKLNSRFTVIIVLLASYLLAACGSASPATLEVKSNGSTSMPVEFAGAVEAIQDDQWTINGQVVQVGPELVKEVRFKVGDQVRVSAIVNADGSVKAEKVVALDRPSATELSAAALTTATLVAPATNTPAPTLAPTLTPEATTTLALAPTADNPGHDSGDDNTGNGDDHNDEHGDENGDD